MIAVTCPQCKTENTRDSRFCKTCATPLPEASPSSVTLTQTLERPLQELSSGALFAGRYQIIEDLGEGGMGHVFKALDCRTGEKIAVKVLRAGLEADGRTLERFSHELTAARRISHRNVCRMFDLGEDRGRLYITMEFVSGEDLKSILRMMGGMSPAQAVGLAVQICDGLEEAHRLGVVHRDLKPANILVDKEGHARIMDFGIARSSRSRGITDTGTMVGTPDYMSPEQVEGRDVDARSDIYAMGVMLFEMVTGRLPFEGDTALAVALKHKTERPPDPKSVVPGLPGDLPRIILKCLEKERSRRYQSAADLRADLEAVAEALPTGSRVVPRRKPATSREITVRFPLKRLAWPVIALAVMIIGAVILQSVLKKDGAGRAAAKVPGSVAVVAFDNQTGEPKYDPLRKVIPSLLITNLENTGLFQVSTWERMRDVLDQMGRKGVDLIDGDSGFDFCRQEGVAFIIVGSFSRAGETFVTEFKLLDPETRKIVKTAAARGSGEASILDTHIDELSRLIAEGMGAGPKLDTTRLAVAEMTTRSTEAYAAYLQGMEHLDRLEEAEAQRSFEKAIELDPEFAIAYLRLGRTLEREGDWERVQAAYKKAKELAGRAPEKERLLIEAKYAQRIERDSPKAAGILKSLVSKYPAEKDLRLELGSLSERSDVDAAIAEYRAALALDPQFGLALNQIAFALLRKQDYAGAQTALERYVAVAPDEFNPHDSLGLLLFLRGRYGEAVDEYKKAMALNNWAGEELPIAYMLAMKEDYDGALTWLDRYVASVSSDALRAEGPAWQGIINYLVGRRALAFERLEAALALARSSRSGHREGIILVVRGFLRSDQGEIERAREDAREARRVLEPIDQQSGQAAWRTAALWADIMGGDRSSLDRVLAELDRIVPPENMPPWTAAFRRGFLISVHLAKGDEEAALREAALPRVFEVLNPGLNLNLASLGGANMPVTIDQIAQLLARRGELDKALEEYRLLMTTGPGTNLRRLINPIYHFRVAGLYEKKGDRARAAEHYRKFLEIWKDADLGLPEPGLAKARLAALTGS